VEQAQIHEQTAQLAEAHKHDLFNRMVAITVAVLALFMVLGKVKDGNIETKMMTTLMVQLDDLNLMQDRSIKQHLFELQIQHWQLMQGLSGLNLRPAEQQQLTALLADWQAEAAHMEQAKTDLKTKADATKAKHDALKIQDQQFHFSEALLTLAITLFAVSALVKSKHLYGVGVGVSVLGIVMELSGFLSWNLHLDFLRFLT
jgi:hypothetical protein